MSKEPRDEWRLEWKLATLEYAEPWGNVSKACRTFGASRSAFHKWRKIYAESGRDGFRQRKPIAQDHPRRIPESAVAKVPELRSQYRLGPSELFCI
jgi:transposase-like protein